jgi:hypothetical protein
MVAPQVPTRWAIEQAVLDHESHRQINHAVGVVTARWRQLREVDVEVLMTFRTVVLRIGDPQVTGAPGVEVAQIMQRALLVRITLGLVPTTRVADAGVESGQRTRATCVPMGQRL